MVTVRWTPVKGPSPGVHAPEVIVKGERLPLDSTLPDGRRLTVRWPRYGDPDVILAGSMLEGSASHPSTTIARGRGALFFGAVLLAMFALGARHASGIVVQLALAAGLGVAAAIAKPLPRASVIVSGFALVAATVGWLALHDRRVVLIIPILFLWIAGVLPILRLPRR